VLLLQELRDFKKRVPPVDGAASTATSTGVSAGEGVRNPASEWKETFRQFVEGELLFVRDPSHREKNDIKLALAAAGFKRVVMETTVV
jgi:hypothetical protein